MASLLQTALQPASQDEQHASEASSAPGVDGTVAVSEVWRILWHRRRWIAGTTALLFACTLVYGLVTPSLYMATAQILVDPRDRQVVSNDVNPSTVSPDGGVTQVESQVSVVQSAGVLLRAIAATDLTNDPEFNGSDALGAAVERIAVRFGRVRSTPLAGERDARTLFGLRRNLTVKRADKVLVIDVGVTSRDPDKSARLANAIASAYLADQASARAAAADAASDALQARLAEQRRRVQDAEDAVERYRTQHNMVVATGQLVSEKQLADVNEQLSAAQSRAATLKSKVDQIRQQRAGGIAPDSTAEAIGSAVVAKLREQESTLAQHEADLGTQLGPRHPAIAAIEMQLRRVRQMIGAELDRVARSVQSDYDRARANETSLADLLDRLKTQTLSNDQTAVHLQELQRERDAVRSIYSNYLVRVQETREQANVDSTNARVISEALVPQQRSWPPLGLLLGGALSGGLGLGAVLALIAEYVAPTVLSPGQVRGLTGAPVIGILPADPAPARRRRLFRREVAPNPDHGPVALAPRTQDRVAMALRRLFGTAGERRERGVARSVLLTSSPADSGERDRVAQMLAIAAARQGERVLLIDADLAGGRRSAAAGLLDVLRGEASLDTVIHFDPGGRFAMMAAGRDERAVREGVERVFAARMFAEAGSRFDLVVIDGGVLTENVRAAPLLAAVERVVLVGQLAATRQSDVAAAVETMGIAGGAFSAVLLVDATAAA